MRKLICLAVCLFAITATSVIAGRIPNNAPDYPVKTRWTYQTKGAVSSPVPLSVRADGAVETIVASESTGRLFVLDADGKVVWERPVAQETVSTPAVGDLNRDGSPDIVLADADGVVRVFTVKGDLIWTARLGARVLGLSGLAMADLDGDGRLEIVVTDHTGGVTCLDADGKRVWTWVTHGREAGPPLLADVNGDGKREIVFSVHDQRVICLQHDGRLLWTFYRPHEYFQNSAQVIGDLDGDGRSEIYAGAGLHHMFALDGPTGKKLWERETNTAVNAMNVVADIDADGVDDLLFGVGKGQVYCIGAGGKTKWKTQVPGYTGAAPVVADLDGDGRAESLWPFYPLGSAVVSPDGELTGVIRTRKHAFVAHTALIDFGGRGNLALVTAGTVSSRHIVCSDLTAKPNAVKWGSFRGNTALTGEGPAPRKFKKTALAKWKKTAPGITVTLPNLIWTGRNTVEYTMDAGTERALAFLLRVDGPDYTRFIFREAFPPGGKKTVDFSVLAAGKHTLTAWAVHGDGLRRAVIAKKKWNHKPFAKDARWIDSTLDTLSRWKQPGKAQWTGIAARHDNLSRRFARLNENLKVKRATRSDRVAFAESMTAVRLELERALGIAAAIKLRDARGTTSPVMWWQINPWSRFQPAKALPVVSSTALNAAACGRENESVTFALFNASDRALEVRLFPTDLKTADGAIMPQKQIRFSRLIQVPNGPVAKIVDDAVAPMGPARVVTIPAWSTQTIWLTMRPMGVKPGFYRGTVTCQPLWWDLKPETIPVELTVLPVTLPEKSELKLCMWSSGTESFLSDYPEETMRDLDDHYYSVYTPMPGPSAAFDSTGALIGKLDFTRHDEMVKRFHPHGFMFFMGTQGAVAVAGHERYGPVWQKGYNTYIRTWMKHLESMGVTRADFAFYPMDEPNSVMTAQTVIKTGKATRIADPTILMYTNPTTGSPREMFLAMKPYIDIYCPSQELLRRDGSWLLPLLRTFDAQIWSYDAPGKAKMLSSFHIQRYFAWQAWVEGFKGIGHWVYAHHNPATTRWMADMREGVGAFFAVVYEGRGPVPSKRWESMREGIEDWMLLDMLRKEIDAAKARGVSADRLKSAEWQVTEMPRQMMKRLRDAGRYVHRMVSDTAFDEVTVELDAAKRAVVKEIVRVRALK